MRNLIPILLAVVVFCYGCDDGQIEGCGSPIEYEGYSYSTVQIGDQCWFSENCRYLPEVSSSSKEPREFSRTTPHFYVYGYNGGNVEEAKRSENYKKYGVLYNWTAANETKICPNGWHIPSAEDLTELINFCLGTTIENIHLEVLSINNSDPQLQLLYEKSGFLLKSDTGWGEDYNGNNLIGFNALPGGVKYTSGPAYNGGIGFWWLSTKYIRPDGLSLASYGFSIRGEYKFRHRQDYGDYVKVDYEDDWIGKSCRCVRD